MRTNQRKKAYFSYFSATTMIIVGTIQHVIGQCSIQPTDVVRQQSHSPARVAGARSRHLHLGDDIEDQAQDEAKKYDGGSFSYWLIGITPLYLPNDAEINLATTELNSDCMGYTMRIKIRTYGCRSFILSRRSSLKSDLRAPVWRVSAVPLKYLITSKLSMFLRLINLDL